MIVCGATVHSTVAAPPHTVDTGNTGHYAIQTDLN